MGNDVLYNSVKYQRVSGNSASGTRFNKFMKDGVDLHYQDIGKHSMSEGDSLYVNVAKDNIKYERIVEWIIPDSRNTYGAYDRDKYKYQDVVWDAIQFKNPFKFPLTTAPVAVYTKNRFSGQQIIHWRDSGEETTVHITKALSVRVRQTENEVQNARDFVMVGGLTFQFITQLGGMTSILKYIAESINNQEVIELGNRLINPRHIIYYEY